MINFVCRKCDRNFDNKTAFKNHKRWHKGLYKRKEFGLTRTCKICKKKKRLGCFRKLYRKEQRRYYYYYTCKKCGNRERYQYAKKNPDWQKERCHISYMRWKIRTVGIECKICGENRTLDVAHIVPRNGKSRGRHRTEPKDNLLGLCPTHHRLFDENRLSDEEYEKIKDLVEIARGKYAIS